ncbi:MAG: hypothetical protein J6B87_01310 [Clostridia bacterium]|nr:hypothetical protein [Clostridia bacterium]
MSKTRQKSLAFALLCLIVGVLHFFFGRAILSAVLYVVEIGLFWIVGAVIAICLIAAVIAATFDVDNLNKAEKWLDKKIAECDECDCDDCDCCCDDEDDDDEIECHIQIRHNKKECACKSENQECECEDEVEEDACDYPYCDECIRECELNEDPDAVNDEVADAAEEASSDDEK